MSSLGRSAVPAWRPAVKSWKSLNPALLMKHEPFEARLVSMAATRTVMAVAARTSAFTAAARGINVAGWKYDVIWWHRLRVTTNASDL